MAQAAILIESEDAKKELSVQVCGKMASLLRVDGYVTGGPVSSVPVLHDLLKQLAANGGLPGVFLVNTFGAREIIPKLDALMGDHPVVYFRRQLFAGKSGLMDQLGSGSGTSDDLGQTLVILNKMRPRLTSIWMYGSKNTDMIARAASRAVAKLLSGEDFSVIERANKSFYGDMSSSR